MKKVIALCTALFLITAVSGCGNSAEESSLSAPTSSSSENSTFDKQNSEEEIVVDPFENVAYYVPELRYTNSDDENIYPSNFIIKLDASDSPFGSNMTFTYFVESAGADEIIIKARANIDEIEDFLEQSKYKVDVTEKIFSIKTSELKIRLISSSLISGDNKTTVIEKMNDSVKSTLEGTTGYTLEKLYVLTPDVEQFNVPERKHKSIITMDEESFENKYLNTSTIQVLDQQLVYSVIGIFKNNEGNYCCAINTKTLLFNKEIIDENSLEFGLIFGDVAELSDNHSNNDVYYLFSDEKIAYEKVTSMHDMENSVIEEIPLS